MSVDVIWDAGFMAEPVDGVVNVVNAAWRGGGSGCDGIGGGGLRGGNGGSLDGLSCEREEEKDLDLATNGLLDLKGLVDSCWVIRGFAVMVSVNNNCRDRTCSAQMQECDPFPSQFLHGQQGGEQRKIRPQKVCLSRQNSWRKISESVRI